jgi:hypothetical protein
MDVDYSRLNPAFHRDYEAFFKDERLHGARLAVVFLAEFRDKNAYAVDVIMKKKPDVLYSLGYVSMSCEGGWAMPVWQHMCNDIKKHKDDAQFRQVATQVARMAPREGRSLILFQFGFRGNWLDLVREALALGIEDRHFPTTEYYHLFSREVIELLEAHKNRKECVICMNADAVSQLPCGHVCMCKSQHKQDVPLVSYSLLNNRQYPLSSS